MEVDSRAAVELSAAAGIREPRKRLASRRPDCPVGQHREAFGKSLQAVNQFDILSFFLVMWKNLPAKG
jgi:hypothetical protein